jgi:hypothetical protein
LEPCAISRRCIKTQQAEIFQLDYIYAPSRPVPDPSAGLCPAGGFYARVASRRIDGFCFRFKVASKKPNKNTAGKAKNHTPRHEAV